jgi:hypothetical protein
VSWLEPTHLQWGPIWFVMSRPATCTWVGSYTLDLQQERYICHTWLTLTVKWPWSSYWIIRCREDRNSQGNWQIIWQAAIHNSTSTYSSLNLLKKLPAFNTIIIIFVPGISAGASPISPADAAMTTYHQQCRFNRKSPKAESQSCHGLRYIGMVWKEVFYG